MDFQDYHRVKFTDSKIQIFCKTPKKGEVKTRLIRELGEVGAASLAASMIEQTMSKAVSADLAPVEIWVASDLNDPFYDQFDSQKNLQVGPDLGSRMQHALTTGLETAERAVLIGTDCPPIDARYLESALNLLATHDVVLGPVEDGGYGLIGVRQTVPDIFSDIDWGTNRVLEETGRKLNSLRISYAYLPLIWDVDEPGDFARYQAWMRETTLD